MKFKDKSEDVERIYSVHYDHKQLKKLLDEIIKKTSYRVSGKFTAPFDAKFEGTKFISGASLPNNDPMYEDIKRIYRFTSNGAYSYPYDSIAVEGTEVTSPELAYIIKGILSGDSNSFSNLLDYKNNCELIPIDEQIANANKAVDEINNYDVDKKISQLTRLKQLLEYKKSGRYFDSELLIQYDLQAISLFELELISEKIINIGNGTRVLLKNLKTIK